MKLKLERPIAFFDLETTGVSFGQDRIVEIAILKVFPDGKKETTTYRVNPTIPIPPQSSEIHGIYDEDIKDAPTFADLAAKLYIYLHDCDLAGYNSNKFDIPVLVDEFQRADYDFDITEKRLVDVQNIFHKMEPRTLSAAYTFYCDKDLENAHSAEADITATYEVLLAQLDKYSEIKNDVSFLDQFTRRHNHVDLAGRFAYNEKKEVVFNFGKHKGKLVTDILSQEPGYYAWMMKGDFAPDTKKILTKLRNSIKK
jgi:DNA polymerase-3 subunit epsilon